MTPVPPVSDPRTAGDSAFPRDASPEDQLRYMLNHAVLAPSVLNTQPWRFVVEGAEVRPSRWTVCASGSPGSSAASVRRS